MACEKIVVNMSVPADKRGWLTRLGKLTGLWEFAIKTRCRARTLPQNAAYWALVIPAATQGFSEQWGYRVSEEEAHETLAEEFLFEERRLVNEATGEIKWVRSRRSTATLSTKEFSEYYESCCLLLAMFCNVAVPDPDPDWREKKGAESE